MTIGDLHRCPRQVRFEIGRALGRPIRDETSRALVMPSMLRRCSSVGRPSPRDETNSSTLLSVGRPRRFSLSTSAAIEDELYKPKVAGPSPEASVAAKSIRLARRD